ncbi:MAG: CoA transferase subunit A [Anaerorhabdus sp.]
MMRNKMISFDALENIFYDGMTIMVGGFMGCGTPHKLIDYLAQSDIQNMTLICNDGALHDFNGEKYYGVAKLINEGKVKKLIATHVGLNEDVSELVNSGKLEVELIPQGSFVEMIRAGGYGLGGVITPTGVGTEIENSEHVYKKIEIDGKEYLIEKPLKADVSLIYGSKVDYAGNIWCEGTTKNFNIAMASAGKVVIAEAGEIVSSECIGHENIAIPSILINYIVGGGNEIG